MVRKNHDEFRAVFLVLRNKMIFSRQAWDKRKETPEIPSFFRRDGAHTLHPRHAELIWAFFSSQQVRRRGLSQTAKVVVGVVSGLSLLGFVAVAGKGWWYRRRKADGPFASSDYAIVTEDGGVDRSAGDGGVTEALLASAESQIHAHATAATRRGSVQDVKA